jgi:hypothetical protein
MTIRYGVWRKRVSGSITGKWGWALHRPALVVGYKFDSRAPFVDQGFGTREEAEALAVLLACLIPEAIGTLEIRTFSPFRRSLSPVEKGTA